MVLCTFTFSLIINSVLAPHAHIKHGLVNTHSLRLNNTTELYDIRVVFGIICSVTCQVSSNSNSCDNIIPRKFFGHSRFMVYDIICCYYFSLSDSRWCLLPWYINSAFTLTSESFLEYEMTSGYKILFQRIYIQTNEQNHIRNTKKGKCLK